MKLNVVKMNQEVKLITMRDLSELNDLIYAATHVTTEGLGKLKKKKERWKEELFWKRRIKGNGLK